MRKLISLLTVIFFLGNANSYANVSSDYTFSSVLGTYTEINGDTVAKATHTSINAGALNDVIYGPFTLPFTFGFNACTPYTTYYISSNGFITFGSGLPGTANYGPIASSETYPGAVSAFGVNLMGVFGTTVDFNSTTNVLSDVRNFDGVVVGRLINSVGPGIPADTYITAFDEALRTITMSKSTIDIIANDLPVQIAAGSIVTKTEGVTPFQVHTIQWTNFRQFIVAGTDDNFNFQIKLYEFDGVIKVIYGSMFKTTVAPLIVAAQVGLRGLGATDFNNRTNTISSNWAASTAGANNAETSGLSNTVAPLPGQTYIWTPACVLPVEMSSLFSSINGRDVTLNWTTATETNNSHYDIERSIVNGEWSKAGNVTGNGTTTSPTSYSFTDRNLASGKYNYRLKQVDFNGSFEYFNLSNEVNVGIPVKFDLSQNYPNPFNPTTKINYDLPLDGRVSLRIFDISGKEVATLVNEIQTAGYYTVTFNGANLSSGMYFYRLSSVSDGNSIFGETKRMILIK